MLGSCWVAVLVGGPDAERNTCDGTLVDGEGLRGQRQLLRGEGLRSRL